jgi:pSer/pThr/pTyr-binding forkhead associated (FHA) protein
VDKPAGDDGRIGTVIDRPNNHSATAQPPRDVVVAGVPHDQSGRAAPDSPADGPSVTPDPPRADTNAVSGERAEPAVTAPIRRVDQAAPGSPKTSTAVPEAARPAHPRELLAKQIAHLEQERVRLAMANEGERPSPAVLHHHDPDPRIAALDDAIMRKQAELNALGPPAEMVFTAGGGEALRVGPGDEVMLGRSHESPLSKARPDEYVSRRHAVLEVDRAGRAWIRDLGSTNGTYVNGERIEPHTKVPLEPGDRVRLGQNYELSAAEHPPRQAEAEGHPPGAKEEAVSPPPEQTPAPRDPAGAVPAQPEAARPTDHAWVEAGDSSGNLRIPRGGEILIGRSTSSPMRAMLADLSDVSRRHATYGLDHDGTPWIRDEGSTNGTRVNGVEILPGEKVRLKAGDVVDFGADNKLRMKIPAAVRNTPVVPPHAPEAHAPAPAERAATPERPDAPASPPVEHPKPAAPPHAPEAHAPAPAERAATPEIRDALAPLLAEHPELTAAPHTVGELKDMLDGLHRDLPFKHIAALRELSYLEHGMEPPAISRERLDTFLDEVWNNRDHLRDGPMEIYRLYASATEPNPITRSPESYANSLVALADSRPPGAEAIIQRSWMDLRTLRDNGHLTLQMMNNGGFFHFRRMGADVNLVTERVYINARADHAPELMSAMVREVVDSPAEFPGVYAAKISSHRSVGNRPDNIVLYANDDAAAKKVIDWLAQYRERNPDAFMWSTPAMTEQVMEGVSRGAEPQVRGESFGTVRAKTIYNALFGKNMEGASRADLLQAALERFAKFGIDPEAPHQNLPRSTP